MYGESHFSDLAEGLNKCLFLPTLVLLIWGLVPRPNSRASPVER